MTKVSDLGSIPRLDEAVARESTAFVLRHSISSHREMPESGMFEGQGACIGLEVSPICRPEDAGRPSAGAFPLTQGSPARIGRVHAHAGMGRVTGAPSSACPLGACPVRAASSLLST